MQISQVNNFPVLVQQQMLGDQIVRGVPQSEHNEQNIFVPRKFKLNRVHFDGEGYHVGLQGGYVTSLVSITNNDIHTMTNVGVTVASYDYVLHHRSYIDTIKPGQTVHRRIMFEVPDEMTPGIHLLLVSINDGNSIRKVQYRPLIVL